MVSKKAKGRTAKEEVKEEGESQNDNNGGGGGASSGYEKIRNQTIKANMERMEKLGVIYLSRKLKSQIHPPKPKIPSRREPPPAPSRRSSRLTGSELAVKKRGEKASKQAEKKTMAVTDRYKPKRPGSAFFLFMEDFRKQHKKKHPDNKSVSVVGKAAGDKWKSMSDAEKAPFVAKAEKRKVEYEKNMQAYKNKQAEGNDAADEEESVKSKSEVHDDDDDDDSGEERRMMVMTSKEAAISRSLEDWEKFV